jgi:hypothetical protein
MDCFAC